MLVSDQGIGNAHPFYVPAEDFCPLGVNLITEQKTFAQHPSGNLGSLAAGGGTQVAHPFSGLGVKQSHRRHCTCLLQIVYAGFVINVQTGAGIRVIIEPILFPGNRISHKGQPGLFSLQRIEPQGHRPGTFQTGQECVIFITQLGFHSR